MQNSGDQPEIPSTFELHGEQSEQQGNEYAYRNLIH